MDKLCRITPYSYNCGWIPYRVWRWDGANTFTAKSVRQREQSPDLMMSSIFTHLWIHSFLSPKPLENTTILPNMGIKWKAGGKATPKPTFPLHYSRFFGVIWNVLLFCNPPSLQLCPGAQPFLPTWCSALCGRHEVIAKSQLPCQTTASSSCQFCSASEKLQDLCWAPT